MRGYSMLIILQELMYRTYVECEGNAPRRDEIPKPCDHFDLIAGTGTGGLIALMLGRLRLDLETCKDVYVRMTKRVFETDKTIAGIPYRSTLFKASKLEEAIKECVREHTIFESEGNDLRSNVGVARSSASTVRNSVATAPYDPNSARQRTLSHSSVSSLSASNPPSSPMSARGSTFINGLRWGNPNALLYDNRENRTKTAVTAMYKGSTRNSSSVFLRSYDSRKEPPPEFNCTVWEAGRATSATGLAFKPIQIGQHVFIDEGPGTYNPAPQVLEEAAANEWPGREIGVFVSIGTGKRPPGTNHQQHEWWEGFFGDSLGAFAEARRRLIAKIEGCEEIHQAMLREHLAKRNVDKANYYRFNVEVGVGEFGMNEWNRLADISTNTRRYLARSDVKRMITDASVKFARIDHMHRRQTSHGPVNEGADSISPSSIVAPPPIPYKMPSPPPRSFAIELPAEVPLEYIHPLQRPQQSSQTRPPYLDATSGPSPEDLLPHHPTPQDAASTAPTRRSTSDIPSARSSHEQVRLASQSQGSLGRSGGAIHEPGVPPPVPPKTPIPYPDQGTEPAVVTMPAALFGRLNLCDDKSRPPYPVDEPPPVVNKQRKPIYHVR